MNKLVNNPTIGSDIEVFVMDKSTKEIVSAEGLIKGTKQKPFNFDKTNKYFATSLDNVLAEFCLPPTTNPFLFIEYIEKSLNYINSVLPEHLCTVAMPAAILDEKHLQTENARRFGCEATLNAWLRCVNPSPEAKNNNLRSAGFHVHIGYDNHNVPTNEKLIKAMDLFLGIPSVLIEPDNDRKLLYGKAGECRFKEEYGLEYRVLSSYFASSKELSSWVYNNTTKAIDFVNDGGSEEIEAVGETIQTAINTNNKVLAGNLIRQFEIELV